MILACYDRRSIVASFVVWLQEAGALSFEEMVEVTGWLSNLFEHPLYINEELLRQLKGGG